MDKDEANFYELVDKIETLCHERGQVSLAEVEKMALEKEVRPSAILEEISLSEDIRLDLAKGIIYCAKRL